MKNREAETSLYGSEVVSKADSQIELRGELDSLLARVVDACAMARERKEENLADELAEVVRAVKMLVLCEAACKEARLDTPLLGWTAEELREGSYHPQKYLQAAHCFPDENTERMVAVLNVLRTEIRRVERCCIRAGLHRYTNKSLQVVLNRLSSAMYIIMLKRNKNILEIEKNEMKKG